MNNLSEIEKKGYMAILEEAMERCRAVLRQTGVQEADLRDSLSMLKLAHSDAERALLGVETSAWQRLRAETIVLVAQLLKPLRQFNPDLSTWERARDPTILVQGRSTRSGGKRPFDYPRIKSVYEEVRRRIWAKVVVREEASEAAGSSEERRDQASENHAFSRYPALEPPAALQAGRSISEPAQPGRERKAGGSEPVMGGPTRPGTNELSGPPGGRFWLKSTDEDSASWTESSGRYRSDKDPRRKHKKQKKYGHQEDDLDFFRGAFQEEARALQNLDLGDDYRYPSDKAFVKYFPEFDFVKAMRGNSLRKWDGSIRDYPGFKHNYYRMVFVQREHYMHKILALETMVPESVKKELFHGLQYTVEDLGQRLRRLEDRYGGEEKQMKHLVNDLQKLQSRGRIPYPELRAAVEDVGAFLERPSTLPGTGETLVVLLKKVIPRHFRTQFKDAMHQWGRPCTGNNFVEYVKRKLNYEIDEVEESEKKELGLNKKPEEKKVAKTLGKLYTAVGESSGENDTPGEGSGEEGECRITNNKMVELPRCKCCDSGKHYLHNCRQFFLVLTLKDRAAFAKQHSLCYKCLRYDHMIEKCPFRSRPDCRFCSSPKHHYLLCPGPASGVVEKAVGEESEEGYGLENIGELIARKNVSTLQLVANIEGPDGRLVPVNILPDTGSSHNILDRKAAERAGLTGFQCKYRVTAHGGRVSEHDAICGEMTLSNPKQPTEKHKVRFYAYDNPCGQFFPVDWSKMKGGWPHLKNLDIPPPVADQPMEMILGCESLKLFETIKPSTVRGAADPVARLTCLGWMVGGRTTPEPSPDVEGESRVIKGDVGIVGGNRVERVSVGNIQNSKRTYNHPKSLVAACQLTLEHNSSECTMEYQRLKTNLARVWELETTEEVARLTNSYYPAVRSERQKRAEAMIMDNLKRTSTGQYQTRLLWSTDRRPRNNYEEAKRAFLNWEKRLETDDNLKQTYHTTMSNWIINDFVENTENNSEEVQNFLTTFMVIKETDEPGKGRLVVNGARKFKNECLNDFLEPGGNMMTDLSELLLRIRRNKYVVCCDLQGMFLNIRVAPEDRAFLRIFYRQQPQDELKVYQFTVHAFGLTSSPCVAMSVVRAHAKRHGDRWPIAEKAVRMNSLVDDIWIMADNRAEVVKGMEEIKALMEEMRITVHKWGSNCPSLLDGIPEEKRAKVVHLTDEGDPAIKALGVVWDTSKDSFCFPKGPPDLAPWTLRRMTSSAGQLFDPLVLLAPATLPAKLLIQHAWRYQDEWDQTLPECLAKKMSLYCRNQTKLQDLRIPRYLGGESKKGRLVIFTDSSKLAQAAAAYWVSETNGVLHSSLVAAKSKVTGMRQHEYIGRLELVGAVLGVALALKICLAFRLPMEEVVYFTDSMAVLYWLSTTASLSAYTGHRVAKICERSSFQQWNYVHTAENPSDLPTRGMRAADLGQCELWWHGPPFLRQPRYKWPEQPPIRPPEEAAAEVRKVEDFASNIVMQTQPSCKGRLELLLTLVQRGLRIRKALRVTELLAQWLYYKFNRPEFCVTFRQLEEDWIRYEQKHHFVRLNNELTQGKMPTQLRELDPRIDTQGLIRVSSGLKNSWNHDWETIFPVLLHEKMRYTKEFVEYTHVKKLGHMGGLNTLMNKVRQRFHVINGRKMSSQVIRECFPCAKKGWRPLQRKMPEFHENRLGNRSLRAFNEIGIDHAGPFQLKQGRGTIEGYILVIACCATRAINLEMSLSTGAEHVLAALQRHIGVFGPPEHINSDQGSGLVRARKLINEHADKLTEEGWDYVGRPKWNVNIPYSPTWSSHVESMVKIVKEALKHLHSGPLITRLTPDEFYTELKRVQGYINMRPLLQLTDNKVPLTPADFIGTGNTWLSSFVYVPSERGASGYRFEQLEDIRKKIWKSFREDYLIWLRRQGGIVEHLPEVGDLVLVQDVPSWKGDGWPVGRVVKIGSPAESPRVYDIEIVPTEELRKHPQMINNKIRLQLKKKIIQRNYRKLGMLPKLKIEL